MKAPKLHTLTLAVLTALTTGLAIADDGDLVRKSMSHDNKVAPHSEAEHAFIQTMKFYVPTQAANGTVEAVDYLNVDEELEDTRNLTKPLIGVYILGPSEGVDGVGFVGHGKRDAWGAVSLDDGVTWKNTNLSESADLSSSDVVREDVDLYAEDDLDTYPGDVVNIFHAVAGNKVLVAWPSRFCSQGQPNYSLDSEENAERRAAIAAYLGIDLTNPAPQNLYLLDMYKVAGQQGSVDYAEDKWEQNHPVGEVPYNCLWTARGVLVNGDDPRTEAVEASFMRWFKPERLTSGRRDVNRIETMCVAGAGCAITWQEDPDGLRPGQGEGPGEGWSGAIANSQTDIWYSYIDWENFDVVQDPADESGATDMEFLSYEEAALGDITQKPKPFVPFAMPMRLTDNAKCNVENPAPYCYGSAIAGTIDAPTDDSGISLDPSRYGLKDMCAEIVTLPSGHNNVPKPVCKTEDGLPLVGNTAATRARLGLFGYDSTGEVEEAVVDSAFVVVQYEEDKGLGRVKYLQDSLTGLPTETICPADADEKDCTSWDIGKNQWYQSFNMSLTVGQGENQDGEETLFSAYPQDTLLGNLAAHGNMLNQPEVDWTTGVFIPTKTAEDLWGAGSGTFEVYNTEIARRASLLAQDISKVHKDVSEAEGRLIALPTWKQGQMNQGGPADVMSRRILIPETIAMVGKGKGKGKGNGGKTVVKGWDLERDGNPYAFRNMACTDWAFQDGTNPFYPEGVCLDPAINMSGTIPDTAIDSQSGEAVVGLYVSEDGTHLVNPILQGIVQGEGNTTKILTWHQCPAEGSVISATDGTAEVNCGEDDNTLDDQSWYNPFDVAKGHRGFLDGDFVMMLYAWSPNWRLNAVGNDRYELYVRRSFDGAQSWTTLPSDYKHWTDVEYSGKGTVVCETYRTADQQQQGDSTEPKVCYQYAAGAPEQARNVTQHKSMKFTTLDPRYAATAGTITSDLFGYGIPNYTSGTGDSEDLRDPSRYFIVYETGDNSTTAFGEPEPLDLFYSRAVMFGDHYQVWAEETDLSVCYPSDPHDQEVSEVVVGSGFCNEFDQLEQGKPGLEASEASLAANPGGEFLYGAWSQLYHEDGSSDAMVRRVWWIDGYISDTDAWDFGQGTGDGEPANP